MTDAMTRATAVRTGIGESFGTFGELLQGELDGHGDRGPRDFLVKQPIAPGVTARVPHPEAAEGARGHPGGKEKALRVARSVLAHHGVTAGGVLSVRSDLPEGKGMSSSSADLTATVRAVCAALDVPATSADGEDRK